MKNLRFLMIGAMMNLSLCAPLCSTEAIRGQLEDGTYYTIINDESSPQQTQEFLKLMDQPGWLEDLTKKVEMTPDGKFMVVDSKIWMNEPNWINKRTHGMALGAALTAAGIGGIIFAAPIAIAAGGISVCSGIYFLVSGYWKDPSYIESVRQTDLASGCAFAYQNGRAGITLTPYERRAAFLHEMVDTPHLLPKSPILLLADLYQFNDPVFGEMFTLDEFNYLNTLKSNFVQQRSDFKMLKENLEKDLANLSAPYAVARDNSLKIAKDAYNQNYYVVSKGILQLQLDVAIADINKAYANHNITLDEKECMINQATKAFEASIAMPDFQKGLNAANIHLAQNELEIKGNYNFQVDIIKQNLQYSQRAEYFNQGQQSLVNYFNQELHYLLSGFPIYHVMFPDYLDLRAKG